MAAILSLPILPLFMYIVGALVGLASGYYNFSTFQHYHYFYIAISFAVSIGLFTRIDQTFSGFFSLNGNPEEGCLSHGFGLITGAMCLDLLAAGLLLFAMFYHKRCNRPVKDD